MQRNSKKRQAILDYLRSTDTHPQAEEIYTLLKPEFPGLSLATVYRNLAQLKKAGLIRSVDAGQERERFDGNPAPHCHAICERCGRVADLPAMPVGEELTRRVEELSGFAGLQPDLYFRGICAACQKTLGSSPVSSGESIHILTE